MIYLWPQHRKRSLTTGGTGTSLTEKLPKKPGDSPQRAYFTTLRLYLDDSVDSDEYRRRLAATGYEVSGPGVRCGRSSRGEERDDE